MSKHNYTQYSNKQKNVNADNAKQAQKPKQADKAPETKSDAVQPKPVVKSVQETVETVTLPKTVKGVVYNCAKLNVRENCIDDSPIVCVLDAKSEIEIDVKKSTDQWFYIYTAIGAEGYCMKQYVEARM